MIERKREKANKTGYPLPHTAADVTGHVGSKTHFSLTAKNRPVE